MRGLLLVLVFGCLVGGCGTSEPKAEHPKADPPRLQIIGLKPLFLGATPKEVQEAVPAPPDAKDIAEQVGADPGLEYMAWELPSKESFAAAFVPGKGAVKMIHRVVMEDLAEAEDAFAEYEKRLGKGTRKKGEGWIEVVYVRKGAKLTLRANDDNGFVTFNENLEDTALDPKVLRKEAISGNQTR